MLFIPFPNSYIYTLYYVKSPDHTVNFYTVYRRAQATPLQ